jgi:putative hydrolase of the HAD superfamily
MTHAKIKAILFDADGVIQRPRVDYHTAFQGLLQLGIGDAGRFIGEVWAAERPSLSGERDFVSDLEQVLMRWNSAHLLDEVLAVWTNIETDSAMLATIAELRAKGMICCLATNQQAHRASYMTAVLREFFDREYYSFRIGISKPDPEYFRTIAKDLGLVPSDLLFIDDYRANVEAARAVGLNAVLFSASPATSRQTLGSLLAAFGISLP